ncbi:MAG: sugar-transfer associated ATP-grasp domain-containing protein [Planctomycetota bacterium]
MTGARRRAWAWPGELSGRGVLGINRRNLELLSPLNPRRFYPRVDDKVITKTICKANGGPIPETDALVERYGDIRRLPELLADRAEFVIKPACGAGGRGIVAVVGRDGDVFRLSGGETFSPSDLCYHVAAILAGLHSLGGRPDRAVDQHPDTGARIAGHRLADWPLILELSTRLSGALEIGYVGVDLVLDAARGPVVLEANARPGLAIQIANRCGLVQRLRQRPVPVEAPVSRGR